MGSGGEGRADRRGLVRPDKNAQTKEQRQVVSDLLSITPETDYKIRHTDGDYALLKLRPDVWFRTAIKTVVSEVVQANSKQVYYTKRVSRDRVARKKMTIVPYHNEVIIKKASLTYVPIWDIELESSTKVYPRKLMAASGAVVSDMLSYCPRHFSLGSNQLVKKEPYAVCEKCGTAVCKDHVVEFDDKFYCNKDNPLKPIERNKTLSIKKGIRSILRK